MTSLSKKGPVFKLKSHGVEVAMWKWVNDDGKAIYSISASRSYKKDGEWFTSSSFNPEDRDLLMDYLDRAFKFAQDCVDADREKRRQEDEAQAA
jgi:hypothetical protein